MNTSLPLGVPKSFLLGVRNIPIESIPGIEETGWKPASRTTRGQQLEESQDIDVLAGMLKIVLNAVCMSFFVKQMIADY